MTNKMNAAKVLLVIIPWLLSVVFSLCPVVATLQLDRQQISAIVVLLQLALTLSWSIPTDGSSQTVVPIFGVTVIHQVQYIMSHIIALCIL